MYTTPNGLGMDSFQVIIFCGVISVIVSVISILVSTSYGCDWLLDWWQMLLRRLGRDDRG